VEIVGGKDEWAPGSPGSSTSVPAPADDRCPPGAELRGSCRERRTCVCLSRGGAPRARHAAWSPGSLRGAPAPRETGMTIILKPTNARAGISSRLPFRQARPQRAQEIPKARSPSAYEARARKPPQARKPIAAL